MRKYERLRGAQKEEEEEAGPYLTGAQPELIRGAASARDGEAEEEAAARGPARLSDNQAR